MTNEQVVKYLRVGAVMLIFTIAFAGWAVVRSFEYSTAQSNQAKQTALVKSDQAKQTALAASRQAKRQAAQFAKAVQTSRYDGALVSCENSNTRHLNALQYVTALDKINPSAGLLATNLLSVLAPLRDGNDGRETCQTYAAAQTALLVHP